ncbi:MAG: hypothetical protein ACRDQ7_09675 [Haloechinothrix sp.]
MPRLAEALEDVTAHLDAVSAELRAAAVSLAAAAHRIDALRGGAAAAWLTAGTVTLYGATGVILCLTLLPLALGAGLVLLAAGSRYVRLVSAEATPVRDEGPPAGTVRQPDDR